VFAIHDVLRSVIDTVTQSAPRKSLVVGFSVADQVPALVQGDPTRLRQVLFNLTANAVKFTEMGQVQIPVSCRETGGDPDHIRVIFAVSDTGIGIAPDKLGLLFLPFGQVDGSYARRTVSPGSRNSLATRLSPCCTPLAIMSSPDSQITPRRPR
jgi:signal transduction histidine kinase